MKYNRIQAMIEMIERNHSVTNKQLCQTFNISLQTLRRDLSYLSEKGLISKVYGGVVYTSNLVVNSAIPSLDDRMLKSEKEKLYIGELAASMIKENDVIFLDSGTTAYRITPYLLNFQRLTVITHSLYVINALADQVNIKLISLGGQLNTETKSFQPTNIDIPYVFDKSFISTVGIDDKGCTNTDINEGKIKRMVIDNSNHVYIVVDHTKFEQQGFNRFIDYKPIEVIITDQAPPTHFKDLYQELKIKVMY